MSCQEQSYKTRQWTTSIVQGRAVNADDVLPVCMWCSRCILIDWYSPCLHRTSSIFNSIAVRMLTWLNTVLFFIHTCIYRPPTLSLSADTESTEQSASVIETVEDSIIRGLVPEQFQHVWGQEGRKMMVQWHNGLVPLYSAVCWRWIRSAWRITSSSAHVGHSQCVINDDALLF